MKRKTKKKNEIVYPIHSHDWTFCLLSESEYKSKIGNDSAAICYFNEKRVYFNKGEFNLKVVIHELVHCLVSENSLSSANLTEDQFEEFMCELLSSYYFRIGLWADDILTRLSTK